MAIHPRIFVGICIASFAGVFPSCAEAGSESRVQQVINSPADFAKASQAGKKAAFLCVNCHGDAGYSAYDYIPNLAGQDAVYLLNQIEKFADGRRQDEFMSGLIKVLKKEDRFNMAIYYSGQPVPASAARNTALAARGMRLFDQICKGCHGAQGHGGEKIARLAGQQPVYLKQSLEQYRAGAKSRSDAIMGSIARRLKDEDIAALTAYIPTMR